VVRSVGDAEGQRSPAPCRASADERPGGLPREGGRRRPLAKAEQAIERYLLAFEAGSLPEAQCGERVRTLGAKIAELRDRRTELAEAIEGADLRPPTEQQIANIRQQVLAAIANGTDRERKTLLQALVHEVRVEGRDRVIPTFRVPFTRGEDTVFTLVDSVDQRGVEPLTSPSERDRGISTFPSSRSGAEERDLKTRTYQSATR
jgi:hypothetical protein